MTAVQDVLNALNDALNSEGVSAEWHNTGGGCMAIYVGWGPETEDSWHKYEVLITDRWDPFGQGDYHSDEGVSGFNAGLYAYKWDQDERSTPDEGVLLYRTADDAAPAASELDPEDEGAFGEPIVLAPEVAAVVSAVVSAVRFVRAADSQGR